MTSLQRSYDRDLKLEKLAQRQKQDGEGSGSGQADGKQPAEYDLWLHHACVCSETLCLVLFSRKDEKRLQLMSSENDDMLIKVGAAASVFLGECSLRCLSILSLPTADARDCEPEHQPASGSAASL